MASRYYVSTALPTELSANLGASGNPSVISLPGDWPEEYPFPALIAWGTATQEAILVTSAPTGTGPYTLPCTRGVDNTTAQAHNAGDSVNHGTTGYEPTLLQTLSSDVATLATEIPSLPMTISQGGTGATNAAAARTALGLSAAATASLPLSVANGGTGSSSGIDGGNA